MKCEAEKVLLTQNIRKNLLRNEQILRDRFISEMDMHKLAMERVQKRIKNLKKKQRDILELQGKVELGECVLTVEQKEKVSRLQAIMDEICECECEEDSLMESMPIEPVYSVLNEVIDGEESSVDRSSVEHSSVEHSKESSVNEERCLHIVMDTTDHDMRTPMKVPSKPIDNSSTHGKVKGNGVSEGKKDDAWAVISSGKKKGNKR